AASAYSTTDGVLYSYIAVPTDSTYGRFERIPESAEGFPTAVARDGNGDAWLAWWKYYDGLFWVHTYTKATCSAPEVRDSSGKPELRWVLSEPAPGSMWTVLRSLSGAPESAVARVEAGKGLELAWRDSDLPADAHASYRIRRECLDVRYQWLSATSV